MNIHRLRDLSLWQSKQFRGEDYIGGGGGGGGTTYNGLYREALLERGIFFTPQVYERIGISRVEVYERVGKSVILVFKRAFRQ